MLGVEHFVSVSKRRSFRPLARCGHPMHTQEELELRRAGALASHENEVQPFVDPSRASHLPLSCFKKLL